MAIITLRIDSYGPPDAAGGWRVHGSLDQQPVGDPVSVTGPKAKEITDISHRFLELFERSGQRPMADPAALHAIGRTLFDFWLGPIRSALAAALTGPGPHELRVSSSDRNVLNLPWELIEMAPGRPIGCDAAWTLWRSSPEQSIPPDGPLRAGPLRILFLAAAPIDEPQLDYEREEDAMLQATARIRGDAVVHFAETGGFEELAERAAPAAP